MPMPLIAVVEDEASLKSDLVEYLRTCGFEALGAGSGAELDRLMADRVVSLVVLDVNLPGEDGFQIAARLRERRNLGVVMVTARGSTVDRVVGLEIGADAYLVKPIEMRELEAQVRAVLRRLEGSATPPCAAESLVVEPADTGEDGRWVLNATDWALTSPAGVRISLTSMEMRLVSVLAQQARQAVSRDQLCQALYNRRWNPDDRSIDTVVGRFRHKVEGATGDTAPVKSVHGVGYVFSAPVKII